MNTITLGYPIYKEVTIDVKKLSAKNKEWLKAWFTDEDERTDKQWNLVESNRFLNIIKEATGDAVDSFFDIDIIDYTE